MTFHPSTKERLLLLVDDIELISTELTGNTLAPKISRVEHNALVDLLVSKDHEFHELLEVAAQQGKVETTMEDLKAKVVVFDHDIQLLQKELKEAEHILSIALFQARQKLSSILLANRRPMPSDDLIKSTTRISATNAVCAPLSWVQGDERRPYPTVIEMRSGMLGKPELNINRTSTAHQNNVSDIQRNTSSSEVPSSFQNQFNSILGELHMSMTTSGNQVTLETRAHKETSQDDVEMMSTDSSSSSSSDSQ